MTQAPTTAEGYVNRLAAGMQAANRLEAQAILAHCRRAGTPGEAVGRARVGRAGAGCQRRLVEVHVLTVERTAAPTAQDATA